MNMEYVEQMDSLVRLLLDRQKQIEDLIELICSDPDGFEVRRVYQTGKGKPYYYVINKEIGKKSYLGSAKSKAVKNEKIKQIRASLLETLDYNWNILDYCLTHYRPCDLSALEKYISPCLKDIPVDFVVNGRMQPIWDWANADYERNAAPFPNKEIYAIDGTRVRSKGECIWYNDFTNMWVPKRYDPLMEFINPKPGILGPGKTIWKSPDFLIKCTDGTYIIVEHLGFIMDDRYSQDFREKTQIYEANGFTLGVNYYVMSDDAEGGTDSRAIHEKVEEIRWKVYHGTGLKPPMREW